MAQYHLGFGRSCRNIRTFSLSAMPVNIHVKGSDVKPLQITLSQSAMWIHLLEDSESLCFPQMIQDDPAGCGGDNVRVDHPKFATHDWGEVNLVVKTGQAASADEKNDPQKNDKASDSERPSPSGPSEQEEGHDSDLNPEVSGHKHAGGGCGGGSAVAAAGGGKGGKSIHGDANALENHHLQEKRQRQR